MFKNSSGGIGLTRYFLTSDAIAMRDSMRYLWLVVKGRVIAMEALTGVDCRSGLSCLGGVLGAMTSWLVVAALVGVATMRTDFFSGSAWFGSTGSCDLEAGFKPSHGNTSRDCDKNRGG